jgi:hypothetical protein
VISDVLAQEDGAAADDIESVLDADARARAYAAETIERTVAA